MTVTADSTPETTPTVDDERADLLAELAQARWFLVNTTRELTDEQVAQRPTVSALCLGGLIKHVASTEEAWIRFILDGPGAMTFGPPEGSTWEDLMAGRCETPQWMIDRGDDFRMLEGETLAGVVARYEDVAARTEEVVRALPDLGVAHPLPDAPWNPPNQVRSARRVLIHVIAETTQHAGHADILRESIDGATSM